MIGNKRMPQISNMKIRIKAAWDKLPQDMKNRLKGEIDQANHDLLDIRNGLTPTHKVHHELALVSSILNDDPHGLIKSAAQSGPEGELTRVGPDGVVYFGGVQYDGTDPKWAYVIIAMAETLDLLPTFPCAGQQIQIPDDATLVILGDWGADNPTVNPMALAPPDKSYYIHLGDVYYAGTNGGETLEPYEQENFLNIWPGAPDRSFALNSNHDMYAHGTGYFGSTLAPGTVFGAQKGTSFFALYNKSFRIVGLDSAYYSPDVMYQVGSLGSPTGPQAVFLKNQALAAASAGQTLILMTHHNGISLDGGTLQPLWTEVSNQLSALSGATVYWYWGHEHAGAVYTKQTMQLQTNSLSIQPRVCGHGRVPWGLASDLQNTNVLWSESKIATQPFVENGFAILSLNGPSLTETFYDQSGVASWSSSQTLM